MKLPKKCGEMYIMFDDAGAPEYGFKVFVNQYSGKAVIEEFIPLSSGTFKTIVLPKVIDDQELVVYNAKDLDISKYSSIRWGSQWKAETMLTKYATGNITITDDCFKGIKEATIVVPFKNSVMLDWGSFEKDAKINLVLPKGFCLKQIYRTFDTGFDYEHENWTLIADEKLGGQWGSHSDHLSVLEYNERYQDYSVADFTILHNDELNKKVDSEIEK